MEYLYHIMILISIYAIVAISFDLLAGQAGLVSVAHAAFIGLGAYTSALMAVRFGAPFVVGVLAGMVVAGALSLFVSLSSLRVRGDYFVIATFGFQIVAVSVLNNWVQLTQGPFGIPGIPQARIFGWVADSEGKFLLLAALLALVVHGLVALLIYSPFGRVLHAIREDELFAESLGKDTLRIKIQVFALSAALAALGGSLYAHYVTYIDPTNFTVSESIFVIAMVAFGGAGSLVGPALGATALVIFPELLRFAGLPAAASANLRQIIYGLILVMIVICRPGGLVGKYRLGR
jgi:branched-chain amino acid transport system permease protein